MDPVFGQSILRVTDATNGVSNTTAYSYWPTFNRNTTALMVLCDGVPHAATFNAAAFTVGELTPLFAAPSPSGPLRGEDLIWSGVAAAKIFGHVGGEIWSYHLLTQQYELVYSGPDVISQWSKSIDDRIAAFHTGETVHVVNIATGVHLRAVTQAGLDEGQIDKTGGFVVIKTGTNGWVLNVATGALEPLTNGAPDFMMGHSDNGTGTGLGFEDFNGVVRLRNLATPHVSTVVFEPWTLQGKWPDGMHLSYLADDETWACASMYQGTFTPTDHPIDNEILLFATDGTSRVRRLCHHRGGGPEYWDGPLANRSRDGKFVAYTSTWEGTLGAGRRDVFIVSTKLLLSRRVLLPSAMTSVRREAEFNVPISADYPIVCIVQAVMSQATLDDPATHVRVEVDVQQGASWQFWAGCVFRGGPNQGRGGTPTEIPGFFAPIAEIAGQRIRVSVTPLGPPVQVGIEVEADENTRAAARAAAQAVGMFIPGLTD